MSSKNQVLAVENLSKSFGSHSVLSQLSLSLTEGESLAVLGPSGCGKSTLLRIIAGLEAANQGRILIQAKVATDAGDAVLAPHERGLSMVFQDLGLWPNLSVLENTMLGLYQRRDLTRALKFKRTMETLELLRIAQLKERKPSQISGGEQQRVALARAIVSNPRLLLFDEPFSGLDLVIKDSLFKELKEILKASSTSLLLVTHDPDEAQVLCTSVLTLEGGVTKDYGPWESVLSSPQSVILRLFGMLRLSQVDSTLTT